MDKGSTIPPQAMLRPADLPWRVAVQPQRDDHLHLPMTSLTCSEDGVSGGGQGRTRYLAPKPDMAVGVHQRTFRDSTDDSYGASLRRVLRECQAKKSPPRLTTVATDVAGEESYLIEYTFDGGRRFYVVVRVGEFYTEIRVSIKKATEEQARGIGEAATKRLCEALDAC